MVKEIVIHVREDMVKIFKAKFDKLESRIFDVEKKNDTLKKEIEKVRKESELREDVLRQAVTDQDETISQQGGWINGLDQYSRRKTLLYLASRKTKLKHQYKQPRK